MELATSFDYVDAALLHRSPQCVVLVNLGSHVEKKEKTVFVKGVEGKTRVRRVVDSTQIWELLDDGIDMWAAFNGKRVEKDATMAQNWNSGPGHHSLLRAASRWGSTVQTTTTRHSGSMDVLCVGARTGVAHESSLLSVRKSENFSQRPLSVLAIVYRIWASARMGQLDGWLRSWVPNSVFSAGGGRGSVEAWYTSAFDIEEVLVGAADSHVHLFDVIKSFDTVDRGGFWIGS